MENNYTALTVEVVDHVAILRLANPPVNALSTALMNELTRELLHLRNRRHSRSRANRRWQDFCAGADRKSRSETIKGPGDLPQHSRRTRECFHAIRELAFSR